MLLAYFHDVKRMLSSVPNQHTELQSTHKTLSTAVQQLQQFAVTSQEKDDAYLMLAARDFAYSLARTYMGELCEFSLAYSGGVARLVYRFGCPKY